jgi:hypothetical protein
MGTNFKNLVDKAYETKPVGEILQAPPDALKGVSAGDADKLREAFGIRTVRDLAENAYFASARAILAAADDPPYDPGPPSQWHTFFSKAPLDFYQQHPAKRFRLEYGPVYYRGRLDGTARVLVVGQDPATDELLAHRPFVGLSGQRLQGLLTKIGLKRSYVIVNTFLYPVFGQFDSELEKISLSPTLLDYRNALFDKLAHDNPLSAVITIGAAPRHAIEHWPGKGTLPIFNLTHPAASESMVLPNWNNALPNIQAIVAPDEGAVADLTPYGTAFTAADEVAIPRHDLPFGIPDWHGVGGGRSQRDGNNKISWNAPPIGG